MSDIIDELRDMLTASLLPSYRRKTEDAIAEIKRLRARIAELEEARAALLDLVTMIVDTEDVWAVVSVFPQWKRAAAALAAKSVASASEPK